jgi:MazG family protein
MPLPPPDHTRGIDRLLAVVRDLRSPEGCPWDRKQTHESLTKYLLEETYEAVEAIQEGSREHLREELGDVLLQVALHGQIGAEQGSFTFEDIAMGIADKLIRRHPHVYGPEEEKVADADAVMTVWQRVKAAEKAAGGQAVEKGFLDAVSTGQPALMRAAGLQKKAAEVGFDWPEVSGVFAKVREEIAEVEAEVAADDREKQAEELGDLLFSVVNLTRFLGQEPETLLTAANNKFQRRFHAMEAHLNATLGKAVTQCSLEESEAAWEAVKLAERT